MRNNELSSLDISQIQRRTYEESKDATRVFLVGGGVDINPEDVKIALQEGIRQLKIPPLEQHSVEIKEIQVPVIIKEIEIKEIEKPVFVKELELREIEKPVFITEYKEIEIPIFIKETVIEKIEVPVIIKEIEFKPIEVVKNVELTISKPILYCIVLQTVITLGLLIHNILK